MNLRDKRPKESEMNGQHEKGTTTSGNSIISDQEMIRKQREVISDLSLQLQQKESAVQKLQFEILKKDDLIVSANEDKVKLNGEIVKLNEEIKRLNRSDQELKESRKILASAAEERQKAEWDRKSATWEHEKAERQFQQNQIENRRLAAMEKNLQKAQRTQNEIIQMHVAREMKRKQKELRLLILKEWYSSVMLVIYSFIMTIYFMIVHWETVESGKEFFPRLINVIRGIWEVAWPAVYDYWFRQFQAETGSLIATIVTALVAAGILFVIVMLFRKWKKAIDNSYDKNDHRKLESTFLIILASLVFSLIICERTGIEMTWIMLWILVSFGANIVYQTIRL